MAQDIWSPTLSTERCIYCNDGSQPRHKIGSEWPIRRCAASISVTIWSKRPRPSSDCSKQQFKDLEIVKQCPGRFTTTRMTTSQLTRLPTLTFVRPFHLATGCVALFGTSAESSFIKPLQDRFIHGARFSFALSARPWDPIATFTRSQRYGHRGT